MNKLVLTVGIGLLFLAACEPINRYLSLPDDNIFEETAEFAVKAETGLDLDFSPSSRE